MVNRLQETSNLCRLSLLLLLLITDEVDSAFYRRCFSLTEYSLCLSTDTSLFVNWNNARTWCTSNNSALIDVASSEVQSKLDEFRNDGSSQLSTVGNWIGVTYRGLTDWHWIDDAPSDSFSVSGSQLSGEVFAAISLFNNQASFSAQTFNKNLGYICQFDAYVSCSGGFTRDSKCYLKYSDTSSWFGACNSCLARKGKLATFTGLYASSSDSGLTSWLQLNGTDAYWIGLTRTTFKRSNGNEVQYSKWSNGNPHLTPSMSPQPCVVHSNDGWRDNFECSSSQQRFVCHESYIPSTPSTAVVEPGSSLSAFSSSPTTSATTSILSSFPSSDVPIPLGTGIGIGFAIGCVTAVVIGVAVYTTVHFVLKTTSRVSRPGVSTVNERPSTTVDSNESFNNNNYMSLSKSTLSEPQVYETMQKTQVLR